MTDSVDELKRILKASVKLSHILFKYIDSRKDWDDVEDCLYYAQVLDKIEEKAEKAMAPKE